MGYVDHAGLMQVSRQSTLPDAQNRVEVRAYADQAEATAALEARRNPGLLGLCRLIILQTLETELYYLEEPPGNAWGEFDDFVRANLVAGLPEEVQHRLLEGPNVTVHDLASGREFSENSVVNIILPFVATFFFYFATMSAAGYMLGVVADEKENRTMEVMLTSLTPGQLIGGKAVGLLAASLTQLAVYVVAAVVALKVAAPYVVELQQAEVPWAYLGMMALFFFPAYGLVAAVLLAIGSAVAEVQQGQQMAGIINLFFMIPIFVLPILFENPGHPLIVALTLFPTTSFLTVSLRWGLGSIPLWQIGLSWVILVGSAILMVWVAARVFRAGMLRYGQPLTLKGMIAAVRG